MKGWEIYKDGWGCGRDVWTRADEDFVWLDWYFMNHNRFRTFWVFIRQPGPVFAKVGDMRLRHRANHIKRQWLLALYHPGRALCRRRMNTLFAELQEAGR